jgi:energy-coupling factor transport system ATP-binding protein
MILQCDAFTLELGTLHLSGDGFSLSGGQIAHIHGLSGSGVNDLLLLIAGLQNIRGQTSPAQGKKVIRTPKYVSIEKLMFLRLLSKPLYEYPDQERARLVGVIFENPELFIVGRNVLEDFQYAFAALGYPPPDNRLLKEYGLYEKTLRRTEHLSGGEQHRLNCASALTLGHKLIIADFSYSNLDADFLKTLYSYLIKSAKGETALIVHGLPRNPSFNAASMSLVVEDGKLSLKDPDPNIFPTSDEERRRLTHAFQSRSIGSGAVLKVDGLCRSGVTQPVFFDIKENEIVQIWGQNGCGKTTLGKSIVGIFKKFDGTFSLDSGVEPVLCLQNPERQFIEMSVIREMPDKELLQFIDISEKDWNTHPRSLCRAKQKLLGTLLTLRRSKGLTILDEPTSGLDFPSKLTFIKLLNKFSDRAVLIFTHDEAIADIGRKLAWEGITS